MFQDVFTKLELEDVAIILDQLNPDFDGIDFDPVNTVIMSVDMPFYPGWRFLDIVEESGGKKVQRFVVYHPENYYILNFTNEPIYKMNQEIPLTLTLDNVCDYVRFFFTYVRGRHGRFLICETVEDIAWKEEPPPPARKAIGQMLKPLSVRAKQAPFEMDATMIFKDSLFKSKITVTLDGLVTIGDEELLIEDIPVYDDVFGQ